MKILVTGATGLIGQSLGPELVRRGHDLLVVSRNADKARKLSPYPCEILEGDLTQFTLKDSRLNQVDAVIHLLGEGIAAKRWSNKQKQKILDSRVQSTQNLVNSFEHAPKVFISASAIGYYGDQKNSLLDEESRAGKGFLSEVCIAWERTVDQIHNKGPTRVIKARLGMVLAKNGGALEKMRRPFQAGLGAAMGSGQQWVSWIHIQDVVGLLVTTLENNWQGAVNFVAPHPATNYELSEALCRVVGRRLGPRVPSFVLKVIFGELAEILLTSQKVMPQKALAAGYQFHFPDLEAALRDCLS